MKVFIDNKLEEDLNLAKGVTLSMINQGYEVEAISLSLTWSTMYPLYAKDYEMPRCKLIEHLFGFRIKSSDNAKAGCANV